jgi:hypothetical protein
MICIYINIRKYNLDIEGFNYRSKQGFYDQYIFHNITNDVRDRYFIKIIVTIIKFS